MIRVLLESTLVTPVGRVRYQVIFADHLLEVLMGDLNSRSGLMEFRGRRKR